MKGLATRTKATLFRCAAGALVLPALACRDAQGYRGSRPMRARRRRTSLVLAAAVLLAACDDLQPPVACFTPEDLTMHVRQDHYFEPCFEDPEMGEIWLHVESSNEGVVTAEVLGYGVDVRAVAVGSATITVTAFDPDNLSASVSFAVRVPNRPPWRRGRIPDVHMFRGGDSEQVVSGYFTDPDYQALTYSAATSDSAVVSATMFGDTLALRGPRVGSATLTVTATDPLGDTVSQVVAATVSDPVDIFRDDFETEASLSDWEISTDSDAIVAEGRLRIYNVVSGLLGWVETEVAASPWEASASMGNATDSVYVSLVAGNDHSRYIAYLLQIGMDDDTYTDLGRTNYRFFVYDALRRIWIYADGWYGTSDWIGDVRDLTAVTLTAQGGELTARVGSEEVVRVDLTGLGWSGRLTYLALVTLPKCCETGHAGVVDWVRLRGIPAVPSSEGGMGSRAGRPPFVGLEDVDLREAVRIVGTRRPAWHLSNRRH